MNNTTPNVGFAGDSGRAWHKAQREYVTWTNVPLPRHYVQTVITLGKKFRQFIGRQGRCLDVGCGNGLFCGRHYKDVGYQYLNKGVVGLDPLTLQGFKPVWLKAYVRGVCESLGFTDGCFDTVVMATTLDHVLDVDCCLRECARVLKRNGTLNIWLTCVYQATSGYTAHPNRFTEPMLDDALTRNGYVVVAKQVSPFWSLSCKGEVATGNTVFIKASKKGGVTKT